jgi:hypothetical protein
MTDLRPARPAAPRRRTVFPQVVSYATLFTAPPDIEDFVGGRCPMCRGALAVGSTGWACLGGTCLAGWDYQGQHGRWLADEPAVPPAAELEPGAGPQRPAVRLSCCGRARLIGALLGVALVPVDAAAAQTLHLAIAGAGWQVTGLAEVDVWFWLLSLAFAPAAHSLLVHLRHFRRRHAHTAAISAGGAA